MPTKPSEAITKHTLNLRRGDMDFLKERFPRLGASGVVRKVVSKFVDRLDLPVPDDQIAEIIADEETLPDE